MALAVVGLVGATMIGCGPSSTTPPQKKDKDEPAKDKASLTLSLGAKSVNIAPGGTGEVKVTVKREKFDDAVTVEFSDLPPGVTVDGGAKQTLEKGVNDKTITLKAADDTKEAENHKAKVTASAKEVKDPVAVELSVTVKKKAE